MPLTLDNLAEHHVAAVQPGGLHGGDEELLDWGSIRGLASQGRMQPQTQALGVWCQRQPCPRSRLQPGCLVPILTWLPLVLGPALAMLSRPGTVCLSAAGRSGAGLGTGNSGCFPTRLGCQHPHRLPLTLGCMPCAPQLTKLSARLSAGLAGSPARSSAHT